jgi:hypothetical protein
MFDWLARRGGDDISATVVRCVEPAHLGGGDDDASRPVVGDQAQEPCKFLAAEAGCR